MILVNGSPGSRLEVTDRGLHYGDGLFETMAVIDGEIPLWNSHMQRFRSGCQRLGLLPPDKPVLRGEVETLAAATRRGIVKLIATRGTGGQGYRPPDLCVPTRVLQRRAWPQHPASNWNQGVRVRVCRTRLAVGGTLAGIKHLNRLEQVIARAEWQDGDIAEGLMLDTDGYVVEGTSSNLFVQEGSRLLTPPVDRCGVAGVMRGEVMAVARRSGLEIAEQRLRLERVLNADALFLTNAVIGIWPVRQIADRGFQVSSEVRVLQQALTQVIGKRSA